MRPRIQPVILSLTAWAITFGVGYALGSYGRSPENPPGAGTVSKIIRTEKPPPPGVAKPAPSANPPAHGKEAEKTVPVSSHAWFAMNPPDVATDSIDGKPPTVAPGIIASLQLTSSQVAGINAALAGTWDALRAHEAKIATSKQLTPDKIEVIVPRWFAQKGEALQTELEGEITRILGEEKGEEFLTHGHAAFNRVFEDYGTNELIVWFERSVLDGKTEWKTTSFTRTEGGGTNQQESPGLDPKTSHLPGFPKE